MIKRSHLRQFLAVVDAGSFTQAATRMRLTQPTLSLGIAELERLVGAQLIAEAVDPHMVRGGVAILISSLASYLPPADPRIDALLDDPKAAGFYDGLAEIHGSEPDMDWAYNYAKLGINKLAERLAVQWAGREVRALSLSPGMIDSEILSTAVTGPNRFDTIRMEMIGCCSAMPVNAFAR